jgi:hypothetical protein
VVGVLMPAAPLWQVRNTAYTIHGSQRAVQSL